MRQLTLPAAAGLLAAVGGAWAQKVPLEPGAAPERLSQVDEFRSDSRKAHASRPVDADEARRLAARRCGTRVDDESGHPMRPLQHGAESFLEGLRMACPQGDPALAAVSMTSRLEGEAQGFKPLILRQLLGSVRGRRPSGVTMDTTAMGCAFELSFRFRRPHRPSVVAEIGSGHPARRPLTEFLERADLDGSERTLDAVCGDSTTVPCLNIAIPPQERTS